MPEPLIPIIQKAFDFNKVKAYLKAKLDHPEKIVLVKTGVFYKRLAKHACAFRLSRELFREHDVRNVGKRLLVRMTCQ